MTVSDLDIDELARTIWDQFMRPCLGSKDDWDHTSEHLREMSRMLVRVVLSAIAEQLA